VDLWRAFEVISVLLHEPQVFVSQLVGLPNFVQRLAHLVQYPNGWLESSCPDVQRARTPNRGLTLTFWFGLVWRFKSAHHTQSGISESGPLRSALEQFKAYAPYFPSRATKSPFDWERLKVASCAFCLARAHRLARRWAVVLGSRFSPME
jgi:hypothetical protein